MLYSMLSIYYPKFCTVAILKQFEHVLAQNDWHRSDLPDLAASHCESPESLSNSILKLAIQIQSRKHPQLNRRIPQDGSNPY